MKTREDFTAEVQRSFNELTQSGMESNQACALSLKLAAGMAEPLLSVQAVRASLDAAATYIKTTQIDPFDVIQSSEQNMEQAALLEDAAVKVHRLFSNPESLHAAFWKPAPHKAGSEAGGEAADQEDSTAAAEESSQTAAAKDKDEDTAVQKTAEKTAAAKDVSKESAEKTATDAENAEAAEKTAADEAQRTAERQSSSSGAGSSGRSDEGSAGLGHATGLKHTAAASTQQAGSADSHKGPDWLRLKGPHEQVVSGMLERLDVPAIVDLYRAITSLRSPRVLYALNSASEKLVLFIMSSPSVANPGFLRQLATLLLNPLLEDVEFNRLVATLCSMLVSLEVDERQAVVHLLAVQPPSEMHRLVIVLQQYITITLYQQQAITQGVEDATKALKLLYDANDMATAALQATSSVSTRANTSPVSYVEFYNDAVNNDDFNLKEDFRRWKSPYRSEFSFCNYPYVYDPASKARVLQMENQMAQYNELQNALFRGLFSGNQQLDLCPFLVLKVRRGAYLVQDTLIQINRAKESDTLRKPLKVKFVGEEGVDEGGVQKEFFQLLVKALFNPDYGMFTYDEATRLHWFRASHLNMETEFELVGVLIGLAIYNSHILEFSFPLVLFKKLTGTKPTFQDLSELYPDIHQNLSKLLKMEDVAACDLQFAVDMECGFGEIEAVELKPGGSQINVTKENCQEYVDLYTQHLLERSILAQYTAFERGFLRLCNGNALSWFRPQELELLACGGQQLDLEALEGATLHDDGYTRDSQVVRWFWETVHAMDDNGKRRLLFFITGSDRVPIKGLAHLNPPHVISRMGGDSDRLPTAHTCFNHLLLPAYTSKEMLQERLRTALEHAEGFGLL